MARYWDGVCGGGVWWSTARTYKNAITNSLYLQVNAALHNRIPGDTVYLQRARRGWTWFRGTGMINGSNLVNDGHQPVHLPQQRPAGVVLQPGRARSAALAELYRATGDAGLLTTARRPGRRLHRPAPRSTPAASCATRASPATAAATARRSRAPTCAGSARSTRCWPTARTAPTCAGRPTPRTPRDRNALDTYGLRWAGPLDTTDAARQHSALDLMNAAP